MSGGLAPRCGRRVTDTSMRDTVSALQTCGNVAPAREHYDLRVADLQANRERKVRAKLERAVAAEAMQQKVRPWNGDRTKQHTNAQYGWRRHQAALTVNDFVLSWK
jgi:hypothetical protein